MKQRMDKEQQTLNGVLSNLIGVVKGRIVIMGLPNKDEIEGKFDQAKGAVKENVGRAIDDKELETEGAADRAGGNLQEGYGTAKRKVGEAIEDVGKAVGK